MLRIQALLSSVPVSAILCLQAFSLIPSALAQVKTQTTLAPIPRAANISNTFTLTATVAPLPAPGKVTFYDGETIIGTEPLTGAMATLTKVALLPGKHSLSALFQGSQGYTGSKSTAVPVLSTSAPTRYFFGNFIGTVSTQAEPSALSQAKIITADFNHDGNLDIVFNPGDGLFVALGNGDGTFQTPTAYLTSCASCTIDDSLLSTFMVPAIST